MEPPDISGDDIWVFGATGIHEPCQVRNEAALSETFMCAERQPGSS